MRGKPARRRKVATEHEHGRCMCRQTMDQLTPGYFWCCNCGRLYEMKESGVWKFAKPRQVKG